MRVLINGLGCPYTGSKFILDQILKSTPAHVRVTAIIPIVKNSIPVDLPQHVSVIKLKHSIWGMYLRVFLELTLNLFMWLRKYDLLINLSNYGLCFSKGQVLYIHSPLLMDMSAPTGFGQGNPNILTRLALNTCLKNAGCIFLQTEHMKRQLQEYCKINKLAFPKNVTVVRPPFPVLAASLRSAFESR